MYINICSVTVVNQYMVNTSYVNGVVLLENPFNQVAFVDYAVTVNDAVPGQIFSTTVPGREGAQTAHNLLVSPSQ